MMLALVRLVLRLLGVTLVAVAMATLMRGGLSFTSQPQMISSDEYDIQHSLMSVRLPLGVAVLGFTLFAVSFLVRRNASGT